MSRQRSRAPARAMFSDDPEVTLLGEMQAYFETRARGLACPARLTAAWDQFYPFYDRLIRHLVRRWHLTGHDLADCVQEAWLAIVERLGRLRPGTEPAHLRAWIAALARSKALDLIRERIRHPRVGFGAEILSELIGQEPDPADEYERHRTQTVVREALDELACRVSAVSYRVLSLRSIAGRTVPEIASELGLTPAQVRKRHHRTMRKLRRLIELRAGKTCPEDSLVPPPIMHTWTIKIQAGETCPGGGIETDNRPKKKSGRRRISWNVCRSSAFS
jgi:RNA polymerase sigma factor (sigma-70 family)